MTELGRLTADRLRIVAILAAGRMEQAVADGDEQRAEIFGSVARQAATVLAERMEVAAVRGLIRDAAALEAALVEDR